MQIFADRLATLSHVEPITHLNITIIPLLGPDENEMEYLLMDEAIEQKLLRITEISESGSVPELQLENHADQAVLLLDGGELVGAKQNRMLNLTILAAAHKTISIPVSCVEAGRWDDRSSEDDEFSSGGCCYSSGRAAKSKHVSKSMRSGDGHYSNQLEVWDGISAMFSSLGSHSPTRAMADIYEDHRSGIDNYIDALKPVEGQVGAIFAINGQVRGLELFNCATTMHKLYPKLIRSWALDAIKEQGEDYQTQIDTAELGRFIAAIGEADTSSHPAIGLGEDIRLDADDLTGGALIVNEHVIHLCAFKTNF